jgi:hypothetical protein
MLTQKNNNLALPKISLDLLRAISYIASEGTNTSIQAYQEAEN